MSPKLPIELSLGIRTELPDQLRVLVEAIPRSTWKKHPGFGGTVQFWMERHMMFRKLLGILEQDHQSLTDRKMEFEIYAPRLSRFTGLLLNELHAHHHIEDTHYFPQLVKLDKRLEKGFSLLDADHHAMDELLQGMAEAANGVLSGEGNPDDIGFFGDTLGRFGILLDRHLNDEEEIIVPVILKSGFDG